MQENSQIPTAEALTLHCHPQGAQCHGAEWDFRQKGPEAVRASFGISGACAMLLARKIVPGLIAGTVSNIKMIEG